MSHNTSLASIVSLLIAGAVSGTTFAQGRHDEKPHGVMKSAPAANEQARVGTGGRHDEGATSHGKKKPVAKKKQAKEQTDNVDTPK